MRRTGYLRKSILFYLLVIATAIHAGKISAAPIAPAAACARLLSSNQIATNEAERIGAITQLFQEDYPIFGSEIFRRALELALREKSVNIKYSQDRVSRSKVLDFLRDLKTDRTGNNGELLRTAAEQTWIKIGEDLGVLEPHASLKGFHFKCLPQSTHGGDMQVIKDLRAKFGDGPDGIWGKIAKAMDWNHIDDNNLGMRINGDLFADLKDFTLSRAAFLQMRNVDKTNPNPTVWTRIGANSAIRKHLALLLPDPKLARQLNIPPEALVSVRALVKMIENSPELKAATRKAIEETIYQAGTPILRDRGLGGICYLGLCLIRGTTPEREISRALAETTEGASAVSLQASDEITLVAAEDTALTYSSLRERLRFPPDPKLIDSYDTVSNYGNDVYRAIHELSFSGLAEKDRLANPVIWNLFLKTLASGEGGRPGALQRLDTLQRQIANFETSLTHQRWIAGQAGETLQKMQTAIETKLANSPTTSDSANAFYRAGLEKAQRRITKEREEVYLIVTGAQAWLQRCEDASAIIRDFQSHLGPYGSGAFEGSTLMMKLETLRELLGYPLPPTPTKALGPKK